MFLKVDVEVFMTEKFRLLNEFPKNLSERYFSDLPPFMILSGEPLRS